MGKAQGEGTSADALWANKKVGMTLRVVGDMLSQHLNSPLVAEHTPVHRLILAKSVVADNLPDDLTILFYSYHRIIEFNFVENGNQLLWPDG